MAIENIIESLTGAYNELISIFPENLKILPSLFFIAIAIALYSIFIWLFYRFLARKDVVKLNLEKYNTYEHSGLLKFFGVLLYIVEFIIITPIAIFLWFAILSTFIIILAKEIEVGSVIFICAALISAIRITSYFKEDLSKDLAKMIPFTLLGVALLTKNFINIETSIARISQIPFFLDNAIYYFLFIVGLETVLRLLYIPIMAIRATKEKS